MSAQEANSNAIHHMAGILNVDEDSGWNISECNLSYFFHDSSWYPNGVQISTQSDTQKVYRVLLQYRMNRSLARQNAKIIASIDPQEGKLLGYKLIENEKKETSIVAPVIAISAFIILVLVFLLFSLKA